MSLEKARAHLAKYGLDDRILLFDKSSATVELAAALVGCEPARIAKTLSFAVGERVALVVFAGDARINNQTFKATFHTKAKMLAPADAERRIGHAVGGVCPFGVSDECDVYLDESLRRFETVYPAAGSSNSAVRLTLSELEQACAPRAWVNVSRLP